MPMPAVIGEIFGSRKWILYRNHFSDKMSSPIKYIFYETKNAK